MLPAKHAYWPSLSSCVNSTTFTLAVTHRRTIARSRAVGRLTYTTMQLLPGKDRPRTGHVQRYQVAVLAGANTLGLARPLSMRRSGPRGESNRSTRGRDHRSARGICVKAAYGQRRDAEFSLRSTPSE